MRSLAITCQVILFVQICLAAWLWTETPTDEQNEMKGGAFWGTMYLALMLTTSVYSLIFILGHTK